MRFEAVGYTDVGTTKQSNQDSYCIKIAESDVGPVALVAVADGMGGLAKGELASSTVIRRLSEWFEQELPVSLEVLDVSGDEISNYLAGQWNALVQELNQRLMRYGREEGINLGTTLTAMLFVGSRYSVVHVGDSRIYEISPEGTVAQITEDQTYVQREVTRGRMTQEEAEIHPKRNVLLQCIGSSRTVVPAIIEGTVTENTCFVLCSDGFRHMLTDEDYAQIGLCVFEETQADREALAIQRLTELTEYVEACGEPDNITALALFAQGGDQ